MVISKFMKIYMTGILLLLSSWAFAQDIPFDPTVPETGAGTGAENAPPPPPAVDNAAPTNAPPPPPAALPAKGANVSDELNGAPPPTDESAPPPVAQVLKKATKKQTPAELSGLGKLAPFSDIAVITKRFLPKTHRFELFPNVGLIMNDAFFSDVALGGRLGFYFNENWGVEASGMTISSSQKGVTNELQAPKPGNYGVQTNSLSTPTSYFGADIKWSPIYGKLAFVNTSIVPFDFYFSAGVGETTAGSSNVTGHLGLGQLFAITKWMAARWDISEYIYSATNSSTGSSSVYTNLHATIGVSFFFPGADYR
jgi:outer membrane beta-barrel protein